MKMTFQMDPQALERIKARMREIAGRVPSAHWSIGLHEEDGEVPALGYDGKPTTAKLIEVALAHEFGTGRLPDRSWLRACFDANAVRWRTAMVRAARAEFQRGETGAIEALAHEMLDTFRAWIADDVGELAPLARTTIAERIAHGLPAGPPLKAIGQLVESIKLNWQVKP